MLFWVPRSRHTKTHLASHSKFNLNGSMNITWLLSLCMHHRYSAAYLLRSAGFLVVDRIHTIFLRAYRPLSSSLFRIVWLETLRHVTIRKCLRTCVTLDTLSRSAINRIYRSLFAVVGSGWLCPGWRQTCPFLRIEPTNLQWHFLALLQRPLYFFVFTQISVSR